MRSAARKGVRWPAAIPLNRSLELLRRRHTSSVLYSVAITQNIPPSSTKRCPKRRWELPHLVRTQFIPCVRRVIAPLTPSGPSVNLHARANPRKAGSPDTPSAWCSGPCAGPACPPPARGTAAPSLLTCPYSPPGCCPAAPSPGRFSSPASGPVIRRGGYVNSVRMFTYQTFPT